MLKKFCGNCLSFLLLAFCSESVCYGQKMPRTVDVLKQERWVDSVFHSMDEAQKLGQLFMVAAYSNKNGTHISEVENLIKNYNIGGLIFFQGGPVRQARLTNRYQSLAKVPLMISMDAEWGLGMRLDSVISFPKQMALGAINDNQYIYNLGAEIARQFREMGMHLNFAPVVDVNSNPANPVIGDRSFGEDKFKVAEKGIAYMKGMQDRFIMANAKHFPGHGDTDTDSHLALPAIKHSKERIDLIELFPFKQLIKNDIQSMMVAHIHLPAWDKTPNRATTLSNAVVTKLLKDDLGFKGLVFTDALNMKGVSRFYAPGEVDLQALLAGNDVLLFSEDVPKAIQKISTAIENGTLNREDIHQRVKKLLRAKYWVGLHTYKPINIENLYERLNTPEALLLKQKLYEEAITLVKNKDNYIPVRVLDTTHFAAVSFGTTAENEFLTTLGKYAPMEKFSLSKEAGIDDYNKLYEKLKDFNTIIAGIHGLISNPSKNFGIRKEEINLLKKLQQKSKVIVVVFGNAYSLKEFEEMENLLCAYQDDPIARLVAPQIIFGALEAKGKLPVSASIKLKEGTGIHTATLKRLSYSVPESAGLDSRVLRKIDQIVDDAILIKAFPGCQVLVARKGTVVYQKSYGYKTYEKNEHEKVTDETIYDIASITKVAATLQTVMFLNGMDLLDTDRKASHYLPELKNTNKKDLKIEDILTHQAGLIPYIPFYQRTIDKAGFSPSYYSSLHNDGFNFEITPGIYLSDYMKDTVWHWVLASDLLEKKKGVKTFEYKYSDLGFYILKKLSENLLNQPMDTFLEQNFYNPLGLSTLGYLPLFRFPKEFIAPTEHDKHFRKTLLQGVVHDEGAALCGGIAGHAGLFSNANDVAILMQMNLQDGYYGGSRYLAPGVVKKFAQQRFPKNRRGMGWDKPATDTTLRSTSDFASPNTYGHTGFTGTAVWIDPDFELVFVFLSNRVHPDANNVKLSKHNVRKRIHDVVYEAMWSYEKTLQY